MQVNHIMHSAMTSDGKFVFAPKKQQPKTVWDKLAVFFFRPLFKAQLEEAMMSDKSIEAINKVLSYWEPMYQRKEDFEPLRYWATAHIFKYMRDDLKCGEICFQAVLSDGANVNYLPQVMQTDEFYKRMTFYRPDLISQMKPEFMTEGFIIRSIEKEVRNIKKVPERMHTPAVCLAAVNKNPLYLQLLRPQTDRVSILNEAIDQAIGQKMAPQFLNAMTEHYFSEGTLFQARLDFTRWNALLSRTDLEQSEQGTAALRNMALKLSLQMDNPAFIEPYRNEIDTLIDHLARLEVDISRQLSLLAEYDKTALMERVAVSGAVESSRASRHWRKEMTL